MIGFPQERPLSLSIAGVQSEREVCALKGIGLSQYLKIAKEQRAPLKEGHKLGEAQVTPERGLRGGSGLKRGVVYDGHGLLQPLISRLRPRPLTKVHINRPY